MQSSYSNLTSSNLPSAGQTLGGQPWLSSAGWDSFWITGPAFFSTAAVLIFHNEMTATQNVPLWVWVCFVLLVDVAHVYATLFRTYFSSQAFVKNKAVLLAMPAVAWIGGSLLYSIDGIYFWRALAYLAVFHFIRQQFGFVALYSRRDNSEFKKYKWLDFAMVYSATLYPILYWHTNMPRNFSWFVAGDFVESLSQQLLADVGRTGLIVYITVAVLYIGKETVLSLRHRLFNAPKNLLIAGTALSWWTGIVAFNSDMAFTITNVVSHGIPYMALVWLYHHRSKKVAPEPGRKISDFKERSWQTVWLTNAGLFFVFLALLAYLEEGLWDGFIWREHVSVFALFSLLPQVTDQAILALLIPFLALPQSTHYLLDGLIWKVKERASVWSA